MKQFLILLGMSACVSAIAFGDSIPYSNIGTVAPTYTFTAATSGDEVAYFYGSTAGYTDLIGVLVNGTQLGSFALNNQTSAFGDSVDFGHVNAGDTIVFALEVASQGYTVYSDPSLNADGINHAYTTSFSGETVNGVTIPAGTFVGFEDLLAPYSDLNYNDEDVVFADITADPVVGTSATPEPASLALLGMGLAGTGLLALRKKRS